MDDLLSNLNPSQKIKLLESCMAKLGEAIIIVAYEPNSFDDAKIVYANEAYSQLTGFSRLETLQKSPEILQGPNTGRHQILKIRRAISKRKSMATELLIYKKNGQESHVDFSLVPLSIDDSDYCYFMAFFIDISKHKQALRSSRENSASLNFVLEVAKFGYWDMDVKANLTERSLRHDQLFGYQELQPVWSYETFLSHVHQDDRDRVDRVYSAAVLDGSDYDVEFRCQWPDGSIHWLWSKGRFLTDQNNEVIRAAGIQVDISEKKATEEVIQNLAYQDPLTKLPNRRSFNQSLKTILAISKRRGDYGALLFMDVDNFKTVNDSLGHDIGDQLLCVLADRLADGLREADIVARFGGDEFVVILSDLGTDRITAERKVDLIHDKIASFFIKPFICNKHEIYSSLSIGITIFNGNMESGGEVLKQADIAMYYAKDTGKNKRCFFENTMREGLTKRTTMEKELRQALTNNEFYLLFQPKLNAQHKVLGFEALIRWAHPQKGTISPLEFIPVAEESGLIVLIGKWVIDEACRVLNSWCTLDRAKNMSLSVNISPKQFAQIDFVDQVISSVAKINHHSDKLILEITENILIENLGSSIGKVNELIKHGINFSLDDFGTGYSSLYYLKNLPIQEIKIDKSFVDDLLTDESDEAIVSAVISIADKLSLSVVAEGVETNEQLTCLKLLGCKIYQGYYFSKPLSELDAITYIHSASQHHDDSG